MTPLLNAVRTLGVSAVLGSSIYLSSEIGHIEGYLFPVAQGYHIESEVPAVGIDGVEISLTFSKVRSCHFELQEAYIPTAKGIWKDVAIYDPKRVGPAFSRPKNTYAVTWLFGYPPSKIGTEIKIVLHHKCWGPGLWETITEINIPPRII